jgi:Na+/melibiose symporter-like transporter
LVLAVSLPSILAKEVPTEQIYQWFTIFLFILMAIALLIFLRWNHFISKEHNRKKANSSFFQSIKSLSKDSRKLLMVYLFSMIASSMPAVLVIFFVRDLLKAQSYTGMFLLIYFLSGALFMPFWKMMSQKYGKYRSWFFAMLLASVSFVWAFFLKEGDIWQYGLICVSSGSALGADLVFPPAILADQMHDSGKHDSACTHYGLLTLTVKASLAIASAISLPMLEIFSFTPNANNSKFALIGLSVSYALIPCIIKCLSSFLLWRIFINEQKGVQYLLMSKKESNHENN